MKVKKTEDKDAKEALQAVKEIAGKFGIETTRWAIRRWDKNMAEKKKLLKMKTQLESDLAAIGRRLG